VARDEELNLPDCLHSVRGWARQVVVVVDSRTTDRTREVAAAGGAEVHEHAFETFAAQKNWALSTIRWQAPWLLIIDADERVSPELRDEIQAVVSGTEPKAAYAMRFRFIFYGQWIRHCWHSTWIVRLFQLNRARYETRGVHEHMIVDGSFGLLQSDLIHNDFKDMDAWIAKHNRYATLEAEELARPEQNALLRGRLFGDPLERRRFLKRIWNRLPLRPAWLFVYLYVFKLGILDGRLGFRFCLMKAIFDAFISAKAWEQRQLAAGPPPNYYRMMLDRYLVQRPEARAYYQPEAMIADD
jgi:glycosyltransferase involved in cell wall biosynthesis